MASSKKALENSIFFQKLVLKESNDPKQKERTSKAIGRLQAELDKLPSRASNPTKRKFSPAQLAAQKLFAERARSGTLGKGTRKTVKRNPVNETVRDAGEFVMTVNGKSKTRFFVIDKDQWANSYGFDYRLLSDVNTHGSPVKFTKTRAIVAIDEGDDGKPITETWAIRELKFYKTNPTNINETVSLYKTPSGKTAMKIQYNVPSDTFSYTGEYGAGSGTSYLRMKNEVSMMLKYHPRVTLASGENFITLGDIGIRRPNPDMYSEAYVKAQKMALAAKDGLLKLGNDIYDFKFDKNEWVYKVTDRNGNYVVNINEKSLSKAKSFLKDYLNNPISAPKQNPDKTKPSAYVKRASQTTGLAPSKRLMTRRKKALTGLAGYFPNPYTMSKSKKKANFPYCVETKNTENWNTKACFKTLAPAKEYGIALSKQYPKLAIRVMQYAGGAM